MAAQPTVLNIQILSPPIHPPPPAQQVLGKRAARSDDVTVQIDVSRPIPYPPTPEVVEALRQRILHLENELAGRGSTSKKAKTTVQTTLPVASGSGSGSGFSGAKTVKTENTKAEKAEIAKMEKESAKTRKSRGKSLFDQLKKAARAEKYQGGPRLVKFEDHFTQADFDLVFGGCGVLVQPTPDNKPTSKVYIRKYTSESDYEALFGDANYKRDQLKGFLWTVGGIHAGKSQKMGQVQLIITSIEIQWSKNTDKLVFKAEVVQEGGCGSGGYDWLDMDGDFGMGGRKRSFW